MSESAEKRLFPKLSQNLLLLGALITLFSLVAIFIIAIDYRWYLIEETLLGLALGLGLVVVAVIIKTLKTDESLEANST